MNDVFLHKVLPMRFILYVIFLFGSLSLFSQSDIKNEELKNVVQQIEGDLNKAKIRVDNLCNNPQTAQKASSWYLKAYVYTEFAKSQVFSTKYPGSDEIALSSVKKALELDNTKQFYSDILNVMTDLTITDYNKAIKNYNQAVNAKNNDKFSTAIHYFELYFDCYETLGLDKKFIDDFIKYNKVSLKSINFYYAYATQTTGQMDKALATYEKIIDLNDNEAAAREKGMPLAYLYYSKLLEQQGNTDKAVAVIKRGVDLFPKQVELIINATSLFNKYKKTDDLVDLLENQNVDKITDLKILFILGQNYRRLSREYEKNGYQSTADQYKQKALKIYQKAITLNPKDQKNLFKVYYNMGVIYFNQGVQMYKTNYENREGFQAEFNHALEYLEKAHEIDKTNKRVMNMMMKAYQMTDQTEKAKGIEQEMYGE